jgi:uncharacterized protein YecE (DUF72 family)
MKIHIGTSGWKYKHWQGGIFYPPELKETDELSFYTGIFKTVELNNSFYHLPDPKTFKQWGKSVPANFIFSVKASRYITHMKKLNETGEALSLFLKHARQLKEHLGPILFQLPPKWKINIERFELFIKKLPKKFRYTFEFRNPTWYHQDIYDLLKKYNCAFCIYELDHHQSPIITTADFIYIRLHGPEGKYNGSYSNQQLKEWAKRCRNWSKSGKEVFIYFDNDQKGYAANNAQSLQTLIKKAPSA